MSYWQDRQLERFERSEKLMEDYYRELEQAFEQAQKEVSGVIYRFYERYAKDNKISLADAKRALSPRELRKFKGSLKEFEQLARESIGTYNLELENLSIKSRITRYEALQAEIKATLNQLYDRDFEQGAGKAMQSVYTDAYSRLNFDLDRYTGLHHHFARVNTGVVETLLKYPFNGLDFSERIWRQNADLEYKLKQALTTAFVQGKNPFELSKEIAKTFDVKRREAYRLLNTEAAFVQGQATADGYKEMGVDKYEICATLDSHTSQTCREQDGKVYEVAKMMVGVNYPPYHPNCRTTTVPVIGESNRTNDTRVARDPKTGKVVKVPANMTYREWKKSFSPTTAKVVDNSLESGIIKSSDIEIGRSLGAAAFRDNVKLPDGTYGRLTEGSIISKVVVFAGKGTQKPVTVAVHLEREYGVPQLEWKKVRGDGYVDVNDVSRHAELHWFESDEAGRVKMKVKRFFE